LLKNQTLVLWQIVEEPDFGSEIKYSLKVLPTKNGSMAAKLKSSA